MCPRRSLPDDVWQWLSIFTHYRAGHLWSRGGVSNQPHVYLEAMKLIEIWSNKLAPQ